MLSLPLSYFAPAGYAVPFLLPRHAGSVRACRVAARNRPPELVGTELVRPARIGPARIGTARIGPALAGTARPPSATAASQRTATASSPSAGQASFQVIVT